MRAEGGLGFPCFFHDLLRLVFDTSRILDKICSVWKVCKPHWNFLKDSCSNPVSCEYRKLLGKDYGQMVAGREGALDRSHPATDEVDWLGAHPGKGSARSSPNQWSTH